jgi:hypothetical protein
MGAANDNILKTLLGFAVVRGMWEGKLGLGGQGLIALCLLSFFRVGRVHLQIVIQNAQYQLQ